MKKIFTFMTIIAMAVTGAMAEQIKYVPVVNEIKADPTYNKGGKFAFLCTFQQLYDEKTHSGSSYPAIYMDVMMPQNDFVEGTYTVKDGSLVKAAYLANVSEGIDYKCGLRFYDASEGTLVLTKKEGKMWNFNLSLKSSSYDVVMDFTCEVNVGEGGKPVTQNYAYEDSTVATYEYKLPNIFIHQEQELYNEYGFVEIKLNSYELGPADFYFGYPEADLIIYPKTIDIPAGTYPLAFDNQPKDGTAAASTGLIDRSESMGYSYPDPCVFWFAADEYRLFHRYLVEGNVYIAYDKAGKIAVKVDAKSAKGSTIRLTHNWSKEMSMENGGDGHQKQVYLTVSSFNPNQGQVTPSSKLCDIGESVSIHAIPNFNFKFTKWSDGNTDNPRTITVTSDTTFIAYFQLSKNGECGNELVWHYTNGTLSIHGMGDMYDYRASSVPWYLLRDSILSISFPDGLTSIGTYAFYGLQNRALKKIIIPQTVTNIGAYAFADCNRLTSIHLPYGLESIGDYAFAGCTRINDITCLAPETPDTYEHTFEEVSRLAYLYVPCENKRAYLLDSHWKDFDIQCIGAEQEDTPVTDVIVVPEENNATITWPSSEDAETYTLVITKDGVVFCTLIFNSNGQLQGIAFAPARNGEKPARSALAVNGGWKFTVTGLDAGTQYDYTITTKNTENQTLSTHTGSFTTAGVTTGVEETTVNKYVNTPAKFFHDGHLLIQREGKSYNMQGTQVE